MADSPESIPQTSPADHRLSPEANLVIHALADAEAEALARIADLEGDGAALRDMLSVALEHLHHARTRIRLLSHHIRALQDLLRQSRAR